MPYEPRRGRAWALNVELQKVLNPPGEIRVERFGWTFGPGDKIMQVENNYHREVYNGDLGLVSRINQEAGELVAIFDGARCPTHSANETSSCWLTPPPFIRVKAANTRPWSCR